MNTLLPAALAAYYAAVDAWADAEAAIMTDARPLALEWRRHRRLVLDAARSTLFRAIEGRAAS